MPLNRDAMIIHFGEASEQLQQILEWLQEGESDEIELRSFVEHLYHHINTGWNTRNDLESLEREESDAEFAFNRRMPEDIGAALTSL
jgi:hypothetical protein